MIKEMRRRFSIFVLIALLLIIGCFVFTINYVNTINMRQQAKATLRMLIANDGRRPPPGRLPSQSTTRNKQWMPPGQPPGDLSYVTDLSNFYTIRLNKSGKITEWFSDRGELYTNSQIREIVARALKMDKTFGRIGSQFYAMDSRPYGSLIVFLDARMEQDNARRLLLSSTVAGIVVYILMSLGALELIRRVTKPVQDAFDKQKQFVWDASHELKTPLAVISANAEALEGDIGENRWLSYIRSEIQRTDQLVKNLLMLAQLDNKPPDQFKNRFDLSQAVLSVTLPFESAVYEAGKHLEIDVRQGIEYTGDEEMIKQMVVILLGNALKYSNDGGTITISLKKKDKCILRVRNTGKGIPKTELPRIFERFYRVDPSRSRDNPGHGLGLAIAKTIVESHKGRIYAESEVGKWVCFTAVLP